MSFIETTTPPGYYIGKMWQECTHPEDAHDMLRVSWVTAARAGPWVDTKEEARRGAWRRWTAEVLRMCPHVSWSACGHILMARDESGSIRVSSNDWHYQRPEKYKVSASIGVWVEEPRYYFTDDIDEAMEKFASLLFGFTGMVADG